MIVQVNKERIKLWVDALRSGEFDQTTGTLGVPAEEESGKDRLCCLGVACEVAMRHGAGVTRKLVYAAGITFTWYEYTCGDYTDDKEMPLPIAHWFGLRSGNPRLTVLHTIANRFNDRVAHPGEYLSAAACNDNFHQNFATIADMIEAEYLRDETKEEQ